MEFFGRALADELVADGQAADLIAGNNVLAQVPDLNDFVGGIAPAAEAARAWRRSNSRISSARSRATSSTQFYHEHYSYFSLIAVERIGAAHGLLLFDVEELATHGGSLRVFFRAGRPGRAGSRARASASCAPESGARATPISRSTAAFGERVERTKRELLQFLIEAKEPASASSATVRRARATRS